MAPIKAGEQFPEGVNFQYIPYQAETSDFKVCGIPIKYDTAKEFKDKKVIIVALPGAFTPTCSAAHLPGYIAKKDELKAKGVDQVIFLAYNDPYVMSGWGKANNVTDDFIKNHIIGQSGLPQIFCTDNNAEFSTSIGWNHGERTARYAIVVDHGKIIYAEKEPDLQGQEVSAVEPVLKAI